MDHAAHLDAWLRSLGFEGDPEMDATGARFTEFLREFVPSAEPPELSLCASTHRGPVAVREIPFHSLCAHHLLPFFGTAAVAYLPQDELAGLGAVPRLVRYLARRPQIQERLTDQIADALAEAVAPRGLVVVTRARHMCVEMRGAASPADVTVVATRGEVDDALMRQVGA